METINFHLRETAKFSQRLSHKLHYFKKISSSRWTYRNLERFFLLNYLYATQSYHYAWMNVSILMSPWISVNVVEWYTLCRNTEDTKCHDKLWKSYIYNVYHNFYAFFFILCTENKYIVGNVFYTSPIILLRAIKGTFNTFPSVRNSLRSRLTSCYTHS